MNKQERETIFFLNKKGEIQYHKRCANCVNKCKQSHKVKGIICPQYEVKK